MPKHTAYTKRIQQIVDNQQEAYRNTDFKVSFGQPLTIQKHVAEALLHIVDELRERKADFVIVPTATCNLKPLEYKFKTQPFYILSIEDPATSFALSEMTNRLTEELRRRVVRGKNNGPKLLKGAQDKAKDFNTQLLQNIESIQNQGFTKKTEIVAKLNEQGFKTRRGELWEHHNLQRVMKQIEKMGL